MMKWLWLVSLPAEDQVCFVHFLGGLKIVCYILWQHRLELEICRNTWVIFERSTISCQTSGSSTVVLSRLLVILLIRLQPRLDFLSPFPRNSISFDIFQERERERERKDNTQINKIFLQIEMVFPQNSVNANENLISFTFVIFLSTPAAFCDFVVISCFCHNFVNFHHRTKAIICKNMYFVSNIVAYLGRASSPLPCGWFDRFEASTFGGADGELGRSRSAPKSIFNKSGRFLVELPDRARRAHDRSKLPYEEGFRSREPLSWPDERRKSIRPLSSSSESTLLRRLRKLPVGVMSVMEYPI